MTVAHIFGRITKSPRSTPAVDAVIAGADKLAILSVGGSFSAMVTEAGTYRLLVTVPGYQEQELAVRITPADLERRVLKTVNVTVQQRRGDAKPRQRAQAGAG